MEEITGRISTLEGKVSEHDRIFDMIKIDVTNERIDDTNKRIEGMDIRLNGKTDSNFKWMPGVQIAMWITIISAILLLH